LYTVLSTCNKVTFPCKYLLSTSLLCLQPCHYRSRCACNPLRVSSGRRLCSVSDSYV